MASDLFVGCDLIFSAENSIQDPKWLCAKTKNQCITCPNTRANRQTLLYGHSNVSRFHSVPQQLRVEAYSKLKIVLRLNSIICDVCHAKPTKETLSVLLESRQNMRYCRADEPCRAWWKRHDSTIKRLLFQSNRLPTIIRKNEKLSKKQLGPFDLSHTHRRVDLELSNPNVKAKYEKKKLESEQRYCSNSVTLVGGRLKQRTNRHENYISYYKLSPYDCFQLCHNTRERIEYMADQCEVTGEAMFFWWWRFYR